MSDRRADLIAELERLADELGRVPTTSDVRDHGDVSLTPYYSHFDGFTNALEAADLEREGRNRGIAREDLLEGLRTFAAEIGEAPTREQMNADGPYSSMPYYREFDSWNDALEAAGLDPNHEYLTDDQLLEDLRRLADEHGEPVRVEDVDEHGKYDPSTYFKRFDSWFDARDQAGLEADDVRPGQRIDRGDLLEALQDLALELGRPPSQNDMADRGPYSARPFYREFGSWSDALEAAGLGTRG